MHHRLSDAVARPGTLRRYTERRPRRGRFAFSRRWTLACANPNAATAGSPRTRRLPRPGRHGLPDGGPPGARGPRGHRLQPQPGQGRAMGRRVRRGAARRRRALPPKAPRSSAPASATTTTCARWCWARTAPSPAWRRRRLRRPHHRVGRGGPRAGRRSARERRLQLHRRTGLRRQPRRGQRHAHGDVRRRRRGLRARAAGGRGLCEGGDVARPERRRSAREDGQPDRHRRPGAGPVGGDRLRRAGRPRHEGRARRHRQGRGAELADGQPRPDDDRAAASTSASPSTGCARTSGSCSTRRGATARSCR